MECHSIEQLTQAKVEPFTEFWRQIKETAVVRALRAQSIPRFELIQVLSTNSYTRPKD